MNWLSARTSYFLIFKRSKVNFCRLTFEEDTAMIKVIYALAVTLVLAAQISLAFAQERLRLAWAGFSPTNSPIWVIEDRKLKIGRASCRERV